MDKTPKHRQAFEKAVDLEASFNEHVADQKETAQCIVVKSKFDRLFEAIKALESINKIAKLFKEILELLQDLST